MKPLPDNLVSLHDGEEELRQKALDIVSQDERLILHIAVVELAMDLADVLRQYPSEDEDLKVIKILGMRMFNAFGASLKLALSGYGQNSALLLRDVLETVFLIDLFRGDRALIEKWRFADKKARMKDFSPVRVREALDRRDGHTERRRAEVYELFSELAAHPTMKSAWMMRPQKEGDAVIGPFIEETGLEAVLSEMGRLAIQAGEQLNAFFPAGYEKALPPRFAFAEAKTKWMERVYGQTSKP